MAKKLELVIAGDAKGALKALRDVETGGGKLTKALRGIGSIGAGVTSQLNSAGGKIIGAVSTLFKRVVQVGTVAIGASIAGGIGRLLNIEDAQAKLRGLGHDTRVVDQVMTDALASVKGTAFGLDAAATAAAGAIASGVKPGADLERTLKLVGDAATIAGADFSEMGGIFNKVGASNRLTMSEVNQLSDRGVPIMQWLADAYGTTGAEASKMVAQGKVDFAAFRDAIETNIGGAALESGNTTRGAFANMIAAANRFGARLAGPAFGQVRGFFVNVTDWIDAAAEKVGPLAERIGEWLPGAFVRAREAVQPALDVVTEALRQAWLGVTALVAAFSGEGITSDGFVGFMERVGVAARDAVIWIRENRDAIERVAAAIVPAIGALAGLAVGVNVVTRVLRVMALATPLGMLLALVSGLIYAWQNSEKFRDIVTAVLGKVREAFTKVQEVVGPVITKVVTWIQGLGKSSADTGSWLGQTWTKIRGIFNTAMEAVKLIVSLATRFITGIWERFGDGILRFIDRTWTNIKRVIDGALKIVQGILDVFIGVFTGDWSRAWDGIKSIVSGAWDVVKGLFGQALNILQTALGTIVAALSTIWSGLWTGIKDAASDAWDGLARGFSGAVATLGRIWDGMKSAMATPINWVIKNVINRFLEGVESIANALPGVNLNLPRVSEIATGSSAGGAPTFGVHHDGGIIGRPNRTRTLAGGLGAGERLIIGKDGEEVLPASDPRHRNNRNATDEGNPEIGGPLGWVGDRIKDAAGSVLAKAREVIANIARPAIEAALSLTDGMAGRFGFPGELVGGVARALGTKVLDWISGVDSEAEEHGGGSLGGRGWRALRAYLERAGVPHVVTSTLRKGNPRSKHYTGAAADFSIGGHGNRGYGHPGLRRMFDAFLPVQHELSELILAGAPFNVRNGKRVPGYAWGVPGGPGNHWNHLHAATYDIGGMLKPGWTMAFNGTGRSERVMTGGQEDRLVRQLERIERVLDRLDRGSGAGGGKTEIHVHGVEDRHGAAQAVALKLRGTG